MSSVLALADTVDRQLADLSQVGACRELRSALSGARAYGVDQKTLVYLRFTG